jgi:hypothetical protein
MSISDELTECNILKLILIVRFACATLDVGYPMKKKLQSACVTDRDSVISTISEIFSGTPTSQFIAICQNRMKRLHWIVNNGGQNYKNWHHRTRIDQTSAKFALTFRSFGPRVGCCDGNSCYQLVCQPMDESGTDKIYEGVETSPM